uniref:C-type lectin domain-containing protein n=1 Tax=Macrostomum lignano TaxID=282301 RepID=A0A1I8FS82_9PLAT
LVAALLLVQLEASRSYSRSMAPPRHYASRHKDTWLEAERFCRAAGLGGLLTTRGGRLGELARQLRPGRCYWVHHSAKSWSSGSSRSAPLSRCPCLLLRRGSLRLHHTTCRHRRRFLCQRGTPIDEFEHRRTTPVPGSGFSSTQRLHAAESPAEPVESTDDSDSMIPAAEGDDEVEYANPQPLLPGDEALDHAKFPVIALGPDGHPKGWLPPWGTAPLMVDFELPEDSQNSTGKGDGSASSATADKDPRSALKALMNGQSSSEVITLLVLYTIVGVTLLVLLGLCLVRCCRRCCGKSRIRYVKQVDADDIPRPRADVLMLLMEQHLLLCRCWLTLEPLSIGCMDFNL